MIRNTVWTLAPVALIAIGLAAPAAAQLQDNLGALSGTNARGYLSPLPKALSGTLNSGIFNSGAVPKTGFNFTVGVRLMGVAFDDADRVYTPTDPPGFSGTGSVQAPTVIGSTQAVEQAGAGGTTLYHPGGFDLGEFAVAVPELTLGSVRGTRAVARWISVDVGNADFGKLELFGVGAQHSVSQYFKGLPVDVAAGVFYQSFKIHKNLVDTSALHFDLTASRSYGPLQPYVGVGFDRFTMKSEYTDGATRTRIAVDFDDESNMHLTLGGLLNFPIVKVHGEMNVAAVNGAAVGLSFGL